MLCAQTTGPDRIDQTPKEATMPLPPPAPRDELHTRRIEVRGYRRHDGLYEVEAHIVDTKALPFPLQSRETVLPVGEHLHDMAIRLVFDKTYRVQEAVAAIDASPHVICPAAAASIAQLTGLSMGAGWGRAVREKLSGAQGCQHLTELLAQMATIAFQTLAPLRHAEPARLDAKGRPVKIDSCFAYASNRELVRVRWPDHYDGPKMD